MNYSELFFKKDLYSITENDVIEFFSQSVEETSILEFKSGNVSIEKIYSEVAALHNSQGGLLIIGSPKPQRDSNGKEFFDGELTMSSFKNKDWLYQKLYSKISPPPVNLKIHDVRCKEGIIQILDIPKSINPPHQCLDDGKYYIRFETETKFAPHGLVEALFNRRKEPIIEISFDTKTLLESESPLRFNLNFSNKSDIPVLNINYIISFFNIQSVYSHHYDKDLKRTMYNSKLTQITDNYLRQNSTLVKGIFSNIDFGIEHFNEPFVVVASSWADNMNLHRKGFLIMPRKELRHRTFDILEDIFCEVVEQIIDIQEKFYESNPEFDWEGFDKLLKKIKPD